MDDVELVHESSSSSTSSTVDVSRRTLNDLLATVLQQTNPAILEEFVRVLESKPKSAWPPSSVRPSRPSAAVGGREETRRPNLLIESRLMQFGSQEMYMIGPKYVADVSVHWLRRIVWSILVLASVVIVIIQIQNRIQTYLSYPSTTTSSVVHARRVNFPQVTICNLNMYSSAGYWNK